MEDNQNAIKHCPTCGADAIKVAFDPAFQAHWSCAQCLARWDSRQLMAAAMANADEAPRQDNASKVERIMAIADRYSVITPGRREKMKAAIEAMVLLSEGEKL